MPNKKTSSKSILSVLPLQFDVALPGSTIHVQNTVPEYLAPLTYAMANSKDIIIVGNLSTYEPVSPMFNLPLYGVLGKIVKVSNTGDLSYTVYIDCVSRVQIVKYNYDECITAEYKLSAPPSLDDELQETFLFKIANLISLLGEGLKHTKNEKLAKAYQYLVSCHDLQDCPYYLASFAISDLEIKSKILETETLLEQYELLEKGLSNELSFIEIQERVNDKVRAASDQNQKEFYIHEQIKALQEELGNGEEDEFEEYEKKIQNLPDEYVREKLTKELHRLMRMTTGSPDASLLRTYLDSCLEIPFTHYYNPPQLSFTALRSKLDSNHYGLEKVKTKIEEYFAVQELTSNTAPQILCLIGPPGVGKTSIAFSIAEALNRPCARISLGGVRDEADIRGHRKTYVGAMMGRIADAIISSKIMNPILILDEIDKMGKSYNGDPCAALLEVLDPEQNKSFRDHYLEFPLDLSKCMFIATANDYDGIPAPLLDRMEVVEINSYSDVEKFHIVKEHIIPKQIPLCGLDKRMVKFTSDAIRKVIREYTKEAGVREAERKIATILRKIGVYFLSTQNQTCEMKVTPDKVTEFLGPSLYIDDNINKNNTPGVINGLAYTALGGAVLNVQVLVLEGQGKIELTGSLGDVMKESALISISFIRSIASKLQIPQDFYSRYDLHIHFPDGATPKDGPSAGVTMTCAIISALTGALPNKDVAMTGEMTLTGQILPIGGLKEKTMAAYKHHIKKVLIPKENQKDYYELDPEVKEHIEFVFCDTIFDLFPHIFLKPDQIYKKETPDAKA